VSLGPDALPSPFLETLPPPALAGEPARVAVAWNGGGCEWIGPRGTMTCGGHQWIPRTLTRKISETLIT
jgi:hypothetical protein